MEDKKYYLLDFNADYGDEFDVNAFKVLTEEEYNKGVEQSKINLEKYFKERGTFSIGFGTNEDIEFDSAKDYWKSFTVKKITKQEADIITKLLGKSYGVCTYFFPVEY